MEKTNALCAEDSRQGVKISAHLADVSIEDQMNRFRDEVARDHETDKIHLLFNNAGIGGGGSFVAGPRSEWERTFNVCWGGVYYGCRAFLPMLLKADEGHIVNTSSVNGFWASLGPGVAHTAYSAAKFAVKGFTEALINDLKLNAPHLKCSVVMPGHIGTDIAINSRLIISGSQDTRLSAEALVGARAQMKRMGVDVDQVSDAQIQALVDDQGRRFRDDAPTTAAQAAKIILDGVKAGEWRILVGDDAHRMDSMVRQDPVHAYEPDFFQKLTENVGWRLGR
jgi:NAD(P)-dependent dehydrogenase (short-subunit alcohol dehydrogenase family)